MWCWTDSSTTSFTATEESVIVEQEENEVRNGQESETRNDPLKLHGSIATASGGVTSMLHVRSQFSEGTVEPIHILVLLDRSVTSVNYKFQWDTKVLNYLPLAQLIEAVGTAELLAARIVTAGIVAVIGIGPDENAAAQQ